jgi:hypothetical protein
VLTFHYEPFDVAWIMRQINRITATIIILNDGEFYNFPTRPNVFLYSSGDFQKNCRAHNENIANEILTKFSK